MDLVLVLAMTAGVLFSVHGKIYERCELARELLDKHEAPMHQIATWVCIAEHESQYNTSAVGEKNGDHSKDHGIFQISDLFWCSPPGNGWACGVTCAELEDDDIEDDFVCARRIYREHKLLSGDGFNAWVVYHTHCSNSVDSYVKGCFKEENQTEAKSVTSTTSLPSTEESSRSSSNVAPVTSTTTLSTSTEVPTTTKSFSRRLFEQKSWFPWFSRLNWS